MDSRATPPFSPVQSRTADDIRALRTRVANTDADPRDEIEHHLAAMRAFALVLAGKRSLADDIVTSTVVAAWADIDAFHPGSNMRAWLFRMLRNVYYADRHLPARGAANDCGAYVDLLRPQAAPDGARVDRCFWRAFNALPDEQREALVLIGPEGFTLQEAAAVCGCAPATIQSRAKLGRRKLAMVVSLETGDARTVREAAGLRQKASCGYGSENEGPSPA